MRILCIFSFLSFFRYIVLVHEVLWPFIDIHCTYFLFYDVNVCFSFTYPFMCCFFSPFIHMLLIICIQSIFFFTQRYLDVFCLKCFRNTGCQSLLAITLFLQSFSRVCIMIDFIVFNKWIQVEWFMTSLICLFVCCGFVTDCQRERLLEHMCFKWLRTYVMILCNWLILWQNSFYLFFGRFRMCLNISRNHISRSSVEAFKSVQENKLIV